MTKGERQFLRVVLPPESMDATDFEQYIRKKAELQNREAEQRKRRLWQVMNFIGWIVGMILGTLIWIAIARTLQLYHP